MKLINFDGVELKVADEAFLIRPIRELFEEDKSKNHEKFWRQMSYLWFMCDPRSSYMYLTNEEDRSAEVKKQEGFGDDWQPSDKLVEAMDRYKSLVVTTSALLLQDVRLGIDNLRTFFRTVNLSETDKNGKPVYQVSSVTGALRQSFELVKMLSEAEKELAKDFESENSARGSLQKSTFEDI